MAMRPWDPLWDDGVSGGKRLFVKLFHCCCWLLFIFVTTSDHVVGRDGGGRPSALFIALLDDMS